MLKPPGKAIYVEGETIDLSAEVSVDDGDHIRQVDFVADDKVIGSVTQAPYTFHWTNPPTGRHEVLAQAVNDKGFKGRSARWQLTVTGKAPAVLGEGWVDFRVGDPGAPGNTTRAAGTAITVSSSTGDLWSNSDAFHYVFHQLDGDGSLTVQVNSIQAEGAGDLTAAGIMIRRDLSAAASEAVLMAIQNPQPSAMFLHRDWLGSDPAYNSATSKTPCWLRIERAGNHVRSYLSSTGEHWTPVGESDLQASDTMYIGLVVAGKGAGHTSAVFDHVELHQGASNVRAIPPGLQEINGTVLTGDLISTDADKLNFRFHGKPFDIKPSDVARVLFRPVQPGALDAIDADKKGVLLATGDLAEGDDIEYRDGRVIVSSVLFGKQNFGLDAAVALIVNDLAPIKTGYTITANDGCVYQSGQLKLDGDKLIIEDAIVGTVALGSGEVRGINKFVEPH
jgi:regulation of enolase protein 1 (concanavalin A-like superfamily)